MTHIVMKVARHRRVEKCCLALRRYRSMGMRINSFSTLGCKLAHKKCILRGLMTKKGFFTINFCAMIRRKYIERIFIFQL